MWLQFFEQNMHFAFYMFASLVFFAVSWLYFDAWSIKHDMKELLKWTGFSTVGISFLIQALIVEQSVAASSVLGSGADVLGTVLRLIGFAVIIAGQVVDPLQAVPKLTGLNLEVPKHETDFKPTTPPAATAETKAPDSGESASQSLKTQYAWYAPIAGVSQWTVPFAGLAIAVLYYRRATTGLERHYKKVAFAFLSFAIADGLRLLSHFRTTDNPQLYSMVRLFGPFWVLQHAILLVGTLYLGSWVWGYLTKRFFSQLLMIFMLTIGTVFLLISIGFTSLLLNDIRTNSLKNLQVSTHVLAYALDAKEAEGAAAAQQIAGTADVVNAVSTKDHEALKALTKDFLVSKKQSGLVITDQAGQVLLRAEDNERWGDSVSSDPLIKRALLGVAKSGVTVDQGVNTPTLQARSAALIHSSDGTIIGTVVSSLNLNAAFVNGVRQETGLNSSLYAGNVLTATTRLGLDGKNSSVGAKLADKKIVNTILKHDKSYSGRLVFANQELLASFLPVKDPDGAAVGILSVDSPESSLLATAGRSVELTFILTAGLLVLSVIPVFLITRNLVDQIK